MRKLLLLFILQLFALRLLATDFTVTSNADGGPGTLRQALTDAAANGSATPDRIVFNIADLSEAGRTITLRSQLPLVTSNLEIDASTQPGNTFAPSWAKIEITVDRFAYNQPTVATAAFILSQLTNVSIYGFYITGFYYLNVNIGSGAATIASIMIAGCQNIKIGAPGKGNMILNSNFDILGNGVFSAYPYYNNLDITVQANYFETVLGSNTSDGVWLHGKNIVFGGSVAEEGNHIATVLDIGGDNIKISNNVNGVDGFGDLTKYRVSGWKFNSCNNLEISYNNSVLLSCDLNTVTNFKMFANIDHCTIEYGSLGINMLYCTDGIIGSEDESLRNVFAANKGNSVDYLSASIGSGASKNIQVLKNEFICSRYPYRINANYPLDPGIPKIKVLVNNNTEYSGTASPLSDVYIYYDNTGCPVCNPVVFYAKVRTDAAGNWKITGNFTDKRWIANALLLTSSSEYTTPWVDVFGYASFNQPNCGQNNGSIELIKAQNTLKVEWYDANNIKVGEGTKIENLGPGNYYPILYNGNCSFKVPYPVYLYDVRTTITANNVVKTNSSCGQNNGAVKGLSISSPTNRPLTFKWTDLSNTIVGQSADLTGVGPGTYTLAVTDINQCTVTYGPVTLINTTGPNIDQSNPTIIPTNCGQSTGFILGVTATGTGNLKYSWKNAQGTEVSTAKDLSGKPAGKYTLQVTDDTNCGPVYTSAIEIPELNGINIDESLAVTAPAACDGNGGGAIKGIKVTGATQYQWFNDANAVVGTSIDLDNAPPGNYHLVASNSTCSKQTVTYPIIKHVNNKTYRFANSQTAYATCDLDNGYIEVAMNTTYDIPMAYRWVNTQGATVGTTLNMTGLPVGTYTLYGTDEFGCEKQIMTTNMLRVPALSFISGPGITTADGCGLGKGSVRGLRVTGGHPPYTYNWKNSAGSEIGSIADIDNLTAGTYTVTITDQTDCGLLTGQYVVGDNPVILPAPSVTNLQLCSAGDALLSVSNPSTGYGYRLYDSANSNTPLDDQQSGKFKITVTAATSYYISQYTGSCESSRAEVKIILGGLSGINLPNTFSPNGDGINDTWKIPGIENYPNANVQIFTRSGQKVYESIGYTTPFDGTYQGKPMPVGSYYYIINLNSGCGLLSGSLTIIR